MAQVTVEVATLGAAARELSRQVGDALTSGVESALDPVLDAAGMAGDDPAATQWAHQYDQLAPAAIQAAEDVVNACYRVAAMLAATARNYARAEQASTAPGHPVDPQVTAAVAALPDDTRVGFATHVPSARGGGSGTPSGWHFITHHLGGYVWPNGHQDRLRTAAAAWSRSATVLDDHAVGAALADLGPLRDRLPESDDIAAVCLGLEQHLSTVAQAHRGLASACTELAGHIDHAHSRIEHELVSLLEWTGAIEGVGAVASVFSLGTAEAPTQVAETARIARTAATVVGILRDFVAAVQALLAEIGPLTTIVSDVRAAVAWLKDLRIVEAEVSAVPGLRVYQVVRTERAGAEAGTAVNLTKDEAALDRLASDTEAAEVPQVTDPQLQNAVKALYRGTRSDARVGDGTTADAIRNELRTGKPTGGKFHLIKGQENVRFLTRWLRTHPNASASDRAVAEALRADLQNALGGK